MSCRHIEPFIVDFARGAGSDHVREDALRRHALGCPSCAGLIERERAMSAALRRLAESVREPPADPQQEQALLAIFDEACAQPHRSAAAPLWAGAAAAALVVAALYGWRPVRPSAIDSAGTPSAIAATPIAPEHSTALDGYQILRTDSQAAGNSRQPAASPVEPGEFIQWPGSAAWPPFERGELVRVSLPAGALHALGVAEPAAPDAPEAIVQADVLVGQDGFARAIRLVQ